MWADRTVTQLLQRAKAKSFNGVIIMAHDDLLTFTTKKHPTVRTVGTVGGQLIDVHCGHC